ncbi:MAG TPA: hypothetical protein VOA41_06775 [Candidatus Dormibacteraeota bacterium]|nr:hypothetical protein [Candidatus Dormibacteraeota bacterium]
MNLRKMVWLGLAILTVACIPPQITLAGPPLICHAIDIGAARSLPWSSNTWNLSGSETYDINQLIDDTLALLGPSMPPLVRMETMRRATLYAQKNPAIAEQLLARLRTRALDAEHNGRPDALAWFDAGYLVETYKQANWLFKKVSDASSTGTPKWTHEEKVNPATGLDGYAWIEKAIKLRGGDAEMEFAAAVITADKASDRASNRGHQEHLQKALAGAKTDPLLARNIATHFGSEKS